jgi:hypothetical protein
MDKAKAAVSSFLSKDGKHDTTVHETVNPAITNENVTRKHHEEAQTLVDREVHQDHHHTSVQPITHKEVLPEKHTHNMAGVETREHRHGNDDHVKQRLAAEAAQFKDTREVGETVHTSSAAPTVAGEHIHHRESTSLFTTAYTNLPRRSRDNPTSHPKGDHPTLRRTHHHSRP